MILSRVQLALGLSLSYAEEPVGVSSLPPTHGFQGLNSVAGFGGRLLYLQSHLTSPIYVRCFYGSQFW